MVNDIARRLERAGAFRRWIIDRMTVDELREYLGERYHRSNSGSSTPALVRVAPVCPTLPGDASEWGRVRSSGVDVGDAAS